MCNCRTGFTGDSCQLRHYDGDLMFVFEDDWKSKFEAIDQHILRQGAKRLIDFKYLSVVSKQLNKTLKFCN